MKLKKYLFSFLFFCFGYVSLMAQPITGFWRGKTGNGMLSRDVEVKLILRGDSIAGTVYYYQSKKRYARYSIKGYFNLYDNTIVWWDDQIIESKSYQQDPLQSEVDFNCPGEGVMKLDGNAHIKQNEEKLMPTHLRKMESPFFTDEWDPLIANYGFGSNNPEEIDSVAAIAFSEKPIPVVKERPVVADLPPVKAPSPVVKKTAAAPVKPEKPSVTAALGLKPQSTEEKFTIRKKEFAAEIPVQADSIIINFYDNAEIDGDTISVYLDSRLIYRNVGLSAKAFTIKFGKEQLQSVSELVMVAENLGSIPPNTSYMSAVVGEKRYEAFLTSTEHSSALIRLRKTIP